MSNQHNHHDPNEIGAQIGGALEKFFEHIEEKTRPQRILNAAQKAFQEHVDTARFDYMAHLEAVFTRHDVTHEVSMTITWQKPEGGQVALLYGENLADEDEVAAIVNTWTVLQDALNTDGEVRKYLDAVDFDNRTIAGAGQYLIDQAGVA